MTELGTVPPPAASESDEQALLQRLRNGEDAAFGELFELHAAAVRRLAQSLAADRSEAEDITAETFFRVLQALRRGAGPRDYVRAYLLTVARRVSWEWHGARRDVPVSDDELTFRAGAGADTHARTAEHSLITTAFTSLPERWRTVLWQTEVEGEQPAMVATHFGLSANATAALARRARQGLRAAYLQAHLSVNRGPDSCRAVVEKLGGFTAGSVTGAEAERIKAHLLGCASCRATQDELRDVCSSLRAHAGVLVLLVPAAGAAASGSGLLAGLGTTVKGVLVGSKVKIGLALASTAAVGAVGVAAGPVLFGSGAVQDVGLTGGAPELVVVPPAESHHQPPPQPQADPRIGIGVLNGRGAGIAVPIRPRGGARQVAANEVPAVPGAEVPVGEAGPGVVAGSGGEIPREDLTSSTFSAPDHPPTSPRLDTTSTEMTESKDTTVPESANAPELSPTGRPDSAPTVTSKPEPKNEDAGATESPEAPEPSVTVTPTSGKPCPASASAVTESGEPAEATSATPAGS
ncbi:sigma-70 family RNA polymerase sigma factor [Amycolatopsis sp. cmx-4-68]|uniref:sigma-70 family RNA polymerase sigma factor n=1 Tax=Amycolatopsis sp. cmx-4-68 TaxID=2790938 RepID=UPI003978CB04